MYYQRTATIDLPPRQSAFLWGARQTGKSTLLRERFQGSVFYDLLDSEVMLRFASRPSLLGEELDAQPAETLAKPVIVDEIQKVPALLDEVHRLIESRDLAFILCGSSARKLKRAGTNLLGGRAWRFELFPLTWAEVPDFDLLQALNRGMLPSIYPQRQYQRSLAAYVRDYLVHEVFNEALTRNVAAFSRFFDALAFCHGELLNFAAIARDLCGRCQDGEDLFRDPQRHSGRPPDLPLSASRKPAGHFGGAEVLSVRHRRCRSGLSPNADPSRGKRIRPGVRALHPA